MSTTQKGNKFEEEVYNFLDNEISNGRFFRREYCTIYRKKSYYSKDRSSNIVFDISIELRLSPNEDYSILILVECKNYNHKVPVDDVEEFYTKMEQISGGNTKGIIASRSAFQRGTFNFSKSKGIGLLRCPKLDRPNWILRRKSSVSSEKYSIKIANAMHNQREGILYFGFYGFA